MLIFLCAACVLTLILLVVTGWRLLPVFGFQRQEVPESFVCRSGEYYLPMQRLLADDDFQFLAERRGVPGRAIAKLRMERRRLFRGFLASLCVDFGFVTSQIRCLMVSSTVSRDDLFLALLKAQLLFAALVFAIECRLFLHACGFSGLTISARNLTEGLAGIRQVLANLALETQPDTSAAMA